MTWSIDLPRRQSLPGDSGWMTGNSPGNKRVSRLLSFITDGVKRRYLLASDAPGRKNALTEEVKHYFKCPDSQLFGQLTDGDSFRIADHLDTASSRDVLNSIPGWERFASDN